MGATVSLEGLAEKLRAVKSRGLATQVHLEKVTGVRSSDDFAGPQRSAASDHPFTGRP